MKHNFYLTMLSITLASLSFTASAASSAKASTIICVTDPCPGRSTNAVATQPTSVDGLGPKYGHASTSIVTVKSVDTKARTVTIEESGKEKTFTLKDGVTPPDVGFQLPVKQLLADYAKGWLD